MFILQFSLQKLTFFRVIILYICKAIKLLYLILPMKRLISSLATCVLITFVTVTNFAQNPLQQYLTNIPSGFSFSSSNVLFAQDIPYDDIDGTRQLFDLFIPSATGSYPLVIHIHGGGFTGGSKSQLYNTASGKNQIKYFINQGIAFASIEYRLISSTDPDTSGVKKPMYDVKRALQFIRYHAKDLKVDPEKIVLTGSSAGAGTSLWLNVHDDMADPNSLDPVLKESTKVCAVFIENPQATYDLTRWEQDVFYNYDGNGATMTTDELIQKLSFQRYSNFYGGVDSVNHVFYDQELIDYRADVDMLALMSEDDGAIYVENEKNTTPQTDPLHYVAHSKTVVDFANAANIREVLYNLTKLSLDNTNGESGNQFLLRHVLAGCPRTYIEEIACDTYTAPDGQVYTSSGKKVAIVPCQTGCDSTIVIDLTVNQNTTNTITESVCETYTAPDGQVYTSSGTKTAVIPSALGCDSTITIQLTVNTTPQQPTITQNGNVLSSSATSGNQWYNQDGPISGETNQEFTPQTEGQYYVIVSNGDCNSESSNIINYTENSTAGINDLTSNKFKISPNPFLDELTIDVNNSEIHYQLLNSLGQVVTEGDIQQKTTISTTQLNAGIYLLKLENNQGIYLQKLIKR